MNPPCSLQTQIRKNKRVYGFELASWGQGLCLSTQRGNQKGTQSSRSLARKQHLLQSRVFLKARATKELSVAAHAPVELGEKRGVEVLG